MKPKKCFFFREKGDKKLRVHLATIFENIFFCSLFLYVVGCAYFLCFLLINFLSKMMDHVVKILQCLSVCDLIFFFILLYFSSSFFFFLKLRVRVGNWVSLFSILCIENVNLT